MSLTTRIQRSRALIRATVPANMKLIADAGLASKPFLSGELVADKFLFIPKTGWWREIDGPRMGYSTRTLIAAAKA